MKSYKVRINNKIYNTISEAAKAIGSFQQNLGLALKLGKSNYKGYTIEKIDNNKINTVIKNTRKGKYQGCPVTCITTNEKFASIQAVANKLNLNAWTIGLKMAKAGKFIDKEGNEYIREQPIQSRKEGVVYPEQKPYMLEGKRGKYTRHTSIKPIENSVTIPTIDVRQNTLTVLQSLGENLTKNKMYKEASYIYEALAQLTK